MILNFDVTVWVFFFSKATSMAACGIEVLQNDMCCASCFNLPRFVCFVSLFIAAVLSPGDI